MLRQVLSFFVLAAVLAALAFGGDDEDAIANFKKYFRTYKDTPSRVEAVLTLEGQETAALVELMLPILKDPEPEVVRAAVHVLASFKERPPIDALVETLKVEKNDALKVGILRAFTEAKYKDVTAAVQPHLADKSWEVRRRALQALAAMNDPSVAELLLPLCEDPEVAVRCEALETLTALKLEAVIPKAIASLNHEAWQVRTTAIAALTKIRHKDSVEPLIARLQVEEGRLVPEIVEALATLTGLESLGADKAKWSAWWAIEKPKFVLPTAEAVAYLRTQRDTTTGSGSNWNHPKTGVAEFHGIQTPSRAIMFVIDVSGSMEAEVTEKDRFADGNYPSYLRIDIVKTELARTIDRLEPYVNFNILAFATKVDPWKKKGLVPANVLNKSAAKDWVKGLVAIGGSSKEDLAAVGLVSAAGLEMGKTNTFGSMMAALNVNSEKVRTGAGDKDYQTDVDTIFFLSDGRPTVGDFVDTDDILREIRTANELRKVVIHTIAIGEFQKDFMRRMAEENGGVFVDLGK